ncbi:MAG: hypothetical protein ACFFG0_19820 [Candidatus Thorarchaeota archaeon]
MYPDDLKMCLLISVHHDGDSDSLVCIVGSTLRVLHGMFII